MKGSSAYDIHRITNDRVITISTFETRAQAEESILCALRWGQEQALELLGELPTLCMDQVRVAGEAAGFPETHPHHGEKSLVLDLRFEVLHPSALGEQAYTDPRVDKMVADIRSLFIQMWADHARQDEVIYRFDRVIRPEEETKSLYTADHVLLNPLFRLIFSPSHLRTSM